MYTKKSAFAFVGLTFILSVILFFASPSLTSIIEEKGNPGLPTDSYSTIADSIQLKHGMDPVNTKSIALVFHKETLLQESDKNAILTKLDELKANGDSFSLISLTTSLNESALKEQLESKDGKTVVVTGSVSVKDKDTTTIRENIEKHLKIDGITTYLTGKIFIDEASDAQTKSGVIFGLIIGAILSLLAFAFFTRSILLPLLHCITVFVTFIITSSLYAIAAKLDFVIVSSFTSLIALPFIYVVSLVLFSIILYQFRHHYKFSNDTTTAISTFIRTKKLSLLLFFLLLLTISVPFYFLQFSLYNSLFIMAFATIVIAILTFTLIPSLFTLLGKLLLTKDSEMNERSIGKFLSAFSLKNAGIIFLIAMIALLPVFINFANKTSFSSVDGVDNNSDAIKGFKMITNQLDPGSPLPISLILESKESWTNQQGMSIVEAISQQLSTIDGVSYVRSAARPFGQPLDPLLLVNQTKTLGSGIQKGNDGVKTIKDGLSEANTTLQKSAPQLQQAKDGIQKLVDGTTKLQNGMTQLSDGLTKIDDGLIKGKAGGKQIRDGLLSARDNTKKLVDGTKQLLAGYASIQANLDTLIKGVGAIKGELTTLQKGIQSSKELAEKLGTSNSALQGNADYQRLVGTLTQLNTGVNSFINEVSKAESGAQMLLAGLVQANTGLKTVVDGQGKLYTGLSQLYTGMDTLYNGLVSASDGQSLIVSKIPDVKNGLSQLGNGGVQLKDGIGMFVSKVGVLQGGLGQTVDGLNQIYTGLNSAKSYLDGVSASSNGVLTGWYLPNDALEQPDFKRIFDTYMSPDGNVTKIDVSFSNFPLSKQGEDTIKAIKSTVERSLQQNNVDNITLGIGGDPSNVFDLKQFMNDDFQLLLTLYSVIAFFLIALLYRNIFYAVVVVATSLFTYFFSSMMLENYITLTTDLPGVKFIVPVLTFVFISGIIMSSFVLLFERNISMTSNIQNNIAAILVAIISALLFFVGFMFKGNTAFVQGSIGIVIGYATIIIFVGSLLLPSLLQKLSANLTDDIKTLS